MLRVRSKRSKEILFVGDLFSDLEYWSGFVRALSDFGNVTMPDLPGMGGMDSFYKIGKTPSIDNYADYLASFFKLKYSRRQVIVIGAGFGFVIVTRMLERYPAIKDRVKMLISLGGFADSDDYTLSNIGLGAFSVGARLFSKRLPATLLKTIGQNRSFLNWFYSRELNKGLSSDKLKQTENRISRLAGVNLRSLAAISYDLSHFSNCDRHIDLPLWHVPVPSKYLDMNRVEQHMCVIFSGFYPIPITDNFNRYPLKKNKRSASYYLPKALKTQLES